MIKQFDTNNKYHISTHHLFKNITGKTFNYLTALGHIGKGYWECRCVCGKVIEVYIGNLTNGQKSCGCINYHTNKKKHNMYDSPEYCSWLSMKSRCTNVNHKSYDKYGGRNITICKEWLDSFDIFYRDMGDRPANSYSLERIDNDKGYYKENCKWATKIEQSNNRKNTKFITYKGKTKPLTIWCAELNIKPSTIRGRLRKGLSIEEAFEPPIKT